MAIAVLIRCGSLEILIELSAVERLGDSKIGESVSLVPVVLQLSHLAGSNWEDAREHEPLHEVHAGGSSVGPSVVIPGLPNDNVTQVDLLARE
jgi:hypothetical protein